MADRSVFWVILVTGLGFFVDSFDVFSYNVMRVPSLIDLGLSGDALTRAGIRILNHQVIGTLIGGFAWGMLGDRIGRKRALFGSILIYSIGMIGNSVVETVEGYTLWRFIIGFGIAGEVGLGATLIGEHMPASRRVWGLAMFSLLGLLGVVGAAVATEFYHWRILYGCGGIAGLVVLGLRCLLMESHLFLSQNPTVFWLPLKQIITSPQIMLRYIACILIVAPNFFITGVILTLTPEIAMAFGITTPVKASYMLAGYFTVATFGDLFGAGLMHWLHNRRRVLRIFLIGNLILSLTFLYGLRSPTDASLYICGALIGAFNLWALSATIVVEQFSTAMRGTVSTSVLNLARALIVVFNIAFLMLKPTTGMIDALALISLTISVIALLATRAIHTQPCLI